MGRYLLRRLLIAIPVIIGVSIVNFLLINLAPGSPVDALIDPAAGPEAREMKQRELGLDQPIHIRYLAWVGEAARGNLGYSYADYRPATAKIAERMGPTAALALASFVMAYTAAVVLGVISALRPYSWIDYLATFSGVFGVSVPSFFFGLAAIYFLSLQIPIFPAGGMLTTGEPFTVPDFLAHLLLPALALALFEMGSLTRYTRASMLETLSEDYVRTARAKGLTGNAVVFGHALRNALSPLISEAGLAFPRILGGVVVIEQVFQWPGMGRLAIQAILQRDYPVLMALNLMIALLVILGSLIADFLYSIADPRIRYSA